ncbi:MAG TPA: 50S ribosomal protein L23 [Candidatus Saccharimonadales bacterium]|nr:50S ribosomal protein L23 [Candidatus Saccharimonadales bacterium]
MLKPRLSEKAYATAQATNTFVIDVPAELNKHEVAAAVEKQFDVKVAAVRTVSRKGKVKRVMNITGRRQSNRKGVQADVKKAYITLKAGSHLPFFEAEETEAKEAAKADEKAKKAEKAKAAPVADQKAKAENKTSHRGLLRARKSGER